jgi:hypothetical protein
MESAKQRRRPNETDEQRQRRHQALAVALADREHRVTAQLASGAGSKPRTRAHVLPLSQIDDEERRLEVWRARVERLEALLDRTARKRETRAKIVLGATLLAEALASPDDPLMARLLEILDKRVERPRDRLAIADTLDLALAPLPRRESPTLPDFDAMATNPPARPRRRRPMGASSPV